MFLAILGCLGASEVGKPPGVSLVDTTFRDTRVLNRLGSGGFSLNVAHISMNVRNCKTEGHAGFVSARGSVFIENSLLASLGPGDYEDKEFKSEDTVQEPHISVEQAGATLSLLRCSFTGFKNKEKDGVCIHCAECSLLSLNETTFTDCAGDWGSVFTKGDKIVCEACTFSICEGKNSLLHVDRLSDEAKALITLADCSFLTIGIDRSNTETGGAGIVIKLVQKLHLTGCKFVDCTHKDGDAGVFGTWQTALTKLKLIDCDFVRTKTNTHNAGCFYINKAIEFEALNCLFEENSAVGDTEERGMGGVFYFDINQMGEAPRVIVTVTSCKVLNVKSRNHAFMYFNGQHKVTSFTLNDTTISGCVTADTTENPFWLDVRATAVAFDNITISDMVKASGSMIRINGELGDDVVLSNCMFNNTETSGFIVMLELTSEAHLSLKSCVFIDVKVHGALNSISQNVISTFSLENCWMERVTNASESSGPLITSTDGQLTLSNCDFIGCVGSPLFQLEGSSIEISTCTIDNTDVQESVSIIQSTGGSGKNVEMSSVKIVSCQTFGSLDAHSAVSLTDVNVSQSSQPSLTISNCGTFSLTKCKLAGIELTATSETITFDQVGIASGSAALTASSSAKISTSDFSIGLSLCGGFTFEDCCFQNGQGSYISKIPDETATLTLVEPMCFDKSKEESIKDLEVEAKDHVFNCDECRGIPEFQTSETDEPSDVVTSESDEPSDVVTSESDEPSDVVTSESDEPSDVVTSESDEPSDVVASESDDSTGGESGGGNEEGKGLPPGVIAAIAVVAVLVVVAVILILILLLRKRKAKSDDSENEMFCDDSVTTEVTVETMTTDEPGPTNPLFAVTEGEEFNADSCFEEIPNSN